MSQTMPTGFLVKDEMNPENHVYFVLQRSPYGVWVSVYQEEPTVDTPDADALLIAKVDFFDTHLSLLHWDNVSRNVDEDDPYKEVIATVGEKGAE